MDNIKQFIYNYNIKCFIYKFFQNFYICYIMVKIYHKMDIFMIILLMVINIKT